ncbi:MAG: hypothetical protein R6X33_00180 [Candidatus Brocadiia bacterium]
MSDERKRPPTAMVDKEAYIAQRLRAVREETEHLAARACEIGIETHEMSSGFYGDAEPEERALRAGCSPVAGILLRWAIDAQAAGVTEQEFIEGLQEDLEVLQLVLEGLETVREELPPGLWPW